MLAETERAGRVASIRKLGGIAFLTLKNGSAQVALVCDRGRMALEEFIKISDIRSYDYCHFSIEQRGDDLCAVRLIKHHRFDAQWQFKEEQAGIVRAYAYLLHSIRAYFFEQNFLEVRLPVIHYGDTRGDRFPLDFFGTQSRLTSSNALFADIYAMQMGPVFSIQKCFRAERSHTRKHLAEFDMLEVASPHAELEEMMGVLEDLIRTVVRAISASSFRGLLQVDDEAIEAVFQRKQYEVVAERLGLSGRGLGQWEEAIAGDTPVFIVGFPRALASWTAEVIDNRHTASFNLLLPKVGEVAEGTQRAHNVTQLKAKFRALGLSRQLGWYADAIAYPGCKSAGFGLGLERLAMWLFGLKNIRQVHPIYRDTKFSEIPTTGPEEAS